VLLEGQAERKQRLGAERLNKASDIEARSALPTVRDIERDGVLRSPLSTFNERSLIADPWLARIIFV